MKDLPSEKFNESGIVAQDPISIEVVLQLLPPSVVASINKAREDMPILFEMDEAELHKHLRKEERSPTPTDNRLRLNFWNEYERARATGKSMRASEVSLGVCTTDYFYSRYLKNPWKICWLLVPPVVYEVAANEALAFGIEQMRDVLSIDHHKNGKVDYQLIKIKHAIVQGLENRVRGSVVQKLETKNLNLHADSKMVEKYAAEMTEEEIERRIKDLETKDRKAAAIVVTAKEVVKS